jgi:hypothetical protein
MLPRVSSRLFHREGWPSASMATTPHLPEVAMLACSVLRTRLGRGLRTHLQCTVRLPRLRTAPQIRGGAERRHAKLPSSADVEHAVLGIALDAAVWSPATTGARRIDRVIAPSPCAAADAMSIVATASNTTVSRSVYSVRKGRSGGLQADQSRGKGSLGVAAWAGGKSGRCRHAET